MRIIHTKFSAVAAAVTMAIMVATSGCRSSGDRTTGQAINDKMTAFNVRRALDSDPVLKYPDVKVNMFNGQVQLTGFVNTDEQRARAAEIASSVKDVRQVVNEITIKPAPTGRAPIQDVNQGSAPPPLQPAPR